MVSNLIDRLSKPPVPLEAIMLAIITHLRQIMDCVPRLSPPST